MEMQFQAIRNRKYDANYQNGFQNGSKGTMAEEAEPANIPNCKYSSYFTKDIKTEEHSGIEVVLFSFNELAEDDRVIKS